MSVARRHRVPRARELYDDGPQPEREGRLPVGADRAKAADPRPLVRRWFLDVIDHEDIDVVLLSLQFEPGLFGKRRKESGVVHWIWELGVFATTRWDHRSSELQMQVISTL